MKNLFKKIAIAIPIATLISAYVVLPVSAANTHSADFELSSAQYFTAADSASLSVTGDSTFETFVKAESLVNDEMTLIWKDDDAGTGFVYRMIIMPFDTTNDWTLYCRVNGTGGASVGAGTIYDLGFDVAMWKHVACTYTASTKAIRLWYAGNEVTKNKANSSLASTITDSTGILYIGANTTPERHWDGLMDEIRISNSVRYTGTFTPPTQDFTADANTMALYHFATLTTDSSGNSNTLTNVNSVTQSTDIPYTDAVVPPRKRTGIIQVQ